MRSHHHSTSRLPSLAVIFLFIATLACAFPDLSTDEDSETIETAVASTLTAIAISGTDVPPMITPTGDEESETPVPTSTQTQTATATATFTPPPSGLSYECDGTYQRTQYVDQGADGKVIIVENWHDGEWVEAWRHEEPDPMISQIEVEAAPFLFGDCQYLVVLPIRYSGSGANLVLAIYRWNGATMEEVYFHEGVHGDWSKLGNTITFIESVYLYDESNCCPCNRQTLEHTWDGEEFLQTGSLIEPTYEGDPPEYCQP
jgi:hypothetical protein